MVRVLRTFTVLSVIIMIITAFVASCFVAVAKAEANISGKMPEITGEIGAFNEKTAPYYEFKVNF